MRRRLQGADVVNSVVDGVTEELGSFSLSVTIGVGIAIFLVGVLQQILQARECGVRSRGRWRSRSKILAMSVGDFGSRLSGSSGYGVLTASFSWIGS